MKIVTLIQLVLLPSLAFAFDGNLSIKELTRTYYLPAEQLSLNTKIRKVQFRLEAKQYSLNPTKINPLSLTQQQARDTATYKRGSIRFNNALIHFQTGYFFRGVFYMEQSFGYVNEQSFSAQKATFNKSKHLLAIPHAVFKSGNNNLAIKRNVSFELK